MGTNADVILVIDDETSLLRSLIAYLEDSGFIAKGAENGKLGLEAFESLQPSLVLTDLHMPGISGLEVLRNIHQKHPDIPVIMISGAGELNDAIEALRLGAWDFITKPISDLQVLEHAIKKALERKKLLEQNKAFAAKIAHNLQVLEEDQAAGRIVQMNLLPNDNERFGNFEFQFKIIPSLQLSGDFVEYFAITNDLVGVYLADVSGHGVSSAFITVLLKGMINKYNVQFHAKKDDTILDPAKLLRALSEEVFNSQLGKYITLIYGVLNLTTNAFNYSIGGHYPNPILFDRHGVTRVLEGRGFPVGIVENATYESFSTQLLPQERLVMFSDGIMDTFAPDKNLAQKEKDLLAVVEANQGTLPGILQGCSLNNTGLSYPDDITILAIGHIT